MNCKGFDQGFLGGCGMAWMGLVLLFFVAAALRKWGGEEMDIPFNFISSLVSGFVGYFVAITFLGSAKWSLLVGLVAVVAAGYLTPYMYEEPTFGGG
jgi:hypothetical protein